MDDPELSIVLPCFNESASIPGLLERFAAVASAIRLELVLVDNGSTDDSGRKLARELAKPAYRFARCVSAPVNRGYGGGIQEGLKSCRAEAVGFSHADLQCPPEDVLAAYRLYQKNSTAGPVLVKGSRTGRSGGDALISGCYNRLSSFVLGYDLGDVNGQPKIFPQSFVSAVHTGPNDLALDLHVVHQAARRGMRIVEFDVRFEERRHGQSKWAHNRLSKARTILQALGRLLQMRLAGNRR